MFELIQEIQKAQDIEKGTMQYFLTIRQNRNKKQVIQYLQNEFATEGKESQIFLNNIFKKIII